MSSSRSSPTNIAALIGNAPLSRIAVIGALWPAVRWADDDEIARTLHAAAADLEHSAQARADFLAALRQLLPATGDVGEDPVPPDARRW